MATDLSVREKELLQRVDEKEELRPIFFKKVKGLKWFDALAARGYFTPEKNPKPVPSKREGYINIPHWPVSDYLVKTAPELSIEENQEYAKKYLRLIIDVSNFAKEKKYSNYNTWWRFAEIVSYLPLEIIDIELINSIDYWMEDEFENDLVAKELGEEWLPNLLESNDNHSLWLSEKVLEVIYKVKFFDRDDFGVNKRESRLRFGYYYAQKITKNVATISGIKLGRIAIKIFQDQLKNIFRAMNNDLWSSIWQPAIETHEQNKYREDAKNILIQAYRDSLIGYIKNDPAEAHSFVNEMLRSEFQTIHRIALFAICENFNNFRNAIDGILDEKYFNSNYRHEMWNLLNHNYQHFTQSQKEKTREIILGISREEDDGKYHEGATAYSKAIWLAAIRGHGKTEARLYGENVKIAKSEPEHPSFSSYMSSGSREWESPFSIEDLQVLTIENLIKELENFKETDQFGGPSLEGLVKTFKELIKTEPLKFYLQLNKFKNIGLAYKREIIEAYGELWVEKTNLPWDGIWNELLEFCSFIISQDDFWSTENDKSDSPQKANRHWVVSSIGRLLESGTQLNEHAFNQKYLSKAEEILVCLLEKEGGSQFDQNSDAVSISINSPRGHCLQALINLTLYACRLSDQKNNKDHSEIWKQFQKYYDQELDRSDSGLHEYEFTTLVTNYLPNFLYMSKDWVLVNLSRIFDSSKYLKWLCAMQGYAYVGTIFPEIFQYLKENDHLLKVLDDENIEDQLKEKAVQNIVISYIKGYEGIEDDNSLIKTLISRNKIDEIKCLIWFIWTLRKKDDENLTNKVYEIWPMILQNIDFSTKEGKRLASYLSQWAGFVVKVDKIKLNLLLAVAPYSDEEYNSYQFLESIAEISQVQPFDAHLIWMAMLKTSTPDYPERAIRQILKNLIKEGNEGFRKAREAVSEYIKIGNDRPSLWLKEIKEEIGTL